ncbi:MAG: hypothetical protein ACTSQJ_12120 [Promethearchaeota archaeon]
MKTFKNFKFDLLLKRHTLLYGDTNTKKTYYTAKFIKFLLEDKKFNPKEISILDFAPNLKEYKNFKIGGRIDLFYNKAHLCNYYPLEEKIIPPRLESFNKNELYENAYHNFKLTNKLLQKYNENITSILIINDISIYLHKGNKNHLLETIKKSETFFGNSYYGNSIKQTFSKLFSLIEKKKVLFLVKNCENTFFTG